MRVIVLKTVFAACFMLGAFSSHAAEKVAFEIQSPLMVAVGEPFRVEFSINVKPEAGSFKAPSFEGFDVLAGPSEAEGWMVQTVNGSMTRTYNFTITYVLVAQNAGTVTIGSSEITADGKSYRTNTLPVEVVAESGSAQQAQQAQQSQKPQQSGDSHVASDDIVLRMIVSRTSVYKGEPLHVVLKIYHRVPIIDCAFSTAPSFNGFWAQDITDSNPATPKRETLGGKIYETGELKEYLLYPQQAGTLAIDPIEVTAVAQVVVQSRRNADPFFGSGHEVLRVPRKIQTQRANITVKNLPAGAPAGFSGAVGRFTMDSKLTAESFAANSAATYTVKISGAGNLTFIQAPKLPLPASFEQYNVKTTESINPSAGGISGYRQFEYPFIARAAGTYNIEPVEFSYFDPERVEYITLRTKAHTLEITSDGTGGEGVAVQGRGMSKEEVQLLGQDIRFIKLGGAQLRANREPLLFSTTYWLLLGGIMALFAAAYTALRKKIRESQNAALVRGRRANKVAVQRLRAAKRYMEEQHRHAFYEEMLRALWGYMSDKFNIPVANLTKENVREELVRRGVAPDEAHRLTAIITRCDEAQYSPMGEVQMSEVYTDGVDILSRIESVIKR